MVGGEQGSPFDWETGPDEMELICMPEGSGK